MTRILKQIPNAGAYADEWDSRVRCAWSTCENPGSMLHYVIECFSGVKAVRRDHPELPRTMRCPDCTKVAFCCEQHADYYRRSHLPGQYGRLAAGTNPRFL